MGTYIRKYQVNENNIFKTTGPTVMTYMIYRYNIIISFPGSLFCINRVPTHSLHRENRERWQKMIRCQGKHREF